MSTTRPSESDAAVGCRRAQVTPVEIDAESLDSTAEEYLRTLKANLAADGYQPATVAASATFDENCSLATQREADRLRSVVRAAAFLGAGRVVVDVEADCTEEKLAPALRALEERAEREGVRLTVEGDADIPTRPA
jgi:sugar phosphate isomerase/epimerase